MNSANADFGRAGEIVLNLTDEQLEQISGGVIHRTSSRHWEVLDQSGNIVATVETKSQAVAKAKELGLSAGQIDWLTYWDMRDKVLNPDGVEDDGD